jgi:hypothetical protein
MEVKVRTADGAIKVLEVSKAMLVQQFRKKVFEAVGIDPKRQRLLFRGKQLEDGCDLLDYRIDRENIIDVTKRVVLAEVDSKNSATKKMLKTKKTRWNLSCQKFSEEREPDDPKPEAGPSTSNRSASSADDQAKSLDLVRELCPDLAAEMEKENGKVEICKKCKNNPTSSVKNVDARFAVERKTKTSSCFASSASSRRTCPA